MTTRLVLDDAVCSMLLYVAVCRCMLLYCTCMYASSPAASKNGTPDLPHWRWHFSIIARLFLRNMRSLADVAQEVAVGPSVTLAALASFVVRFCLGSDVSC
jgi:hypothetical protein